MANVGYEISEWFLEFRKISNSFPVMRVIKSKFEDGDWVCDENGIRREDKKYFEISFYKVTDATRQVNRWKQPLQKEVGVGVVYLVVDKKMRILAQVLQEPGNNPEENYCSFASTIQASWDNAKGAHGGNLPPSLEALCKRADVKPEDVVRAKVRKGGGRFKDSVIELGIVRVENIEDMQLEDREVVLSQQDVKEAFLAGFLNAELREALGLCAVFYK